MSHMTTLALPSKARTARWFHALSDETRVEIVEMLSHGERCVCELMDSLDAAQSRLSFHLKTLKDAGLVTDRREGRWVYYSLDRAALNEMVEFLGGVKPGKHAGSCAKACC
jgi:ArsR family transcriptional regulator, arsenate/arsenite/antimonite-responsive transcriptional repressor